jgi:DNA-binding GntR family transcriptional regulator
MPSLHDDSKLSRPLSTARRLERELRAAIVKFELAPGQRLTELDIAIHYGVSRQPVREAFIGLDRAGLITVQPQRGTIVALLSSRRLQDGQFVREAVETALVRRGCAGFDADARRAIEQQLAIQADAAARGDRAAFLDADAEFHRALAAGCGVPSAWEALENIKTHVDRAWWLAGPEAAPLHLMLDQHRAILKAIDAGDAAAAERAVRAHLADILAALPRLAAEHRDMFL